MTHQLELPDEVYQKLEMSAKEQGVTPAEWIAARLSHHHVNNAEGGQGSPEEQSLSETLREYIGVIDSSQEPYSADERTPLGDMVAEQLASQGIKAPWQR
ncbi:MAG: hypothetical protein JO182_19385 [Acidobacteriaceae bacterium]|nr:hypothetical protein [Acidobacteriaceae bacterium]